MTSRKSLLKNGEQIRIDIVGAGGNGSQMLHKLARIHLGMLARGDTKGLSVNIFDDDKVTEPNVGRGFYHADVGQYKSILMAHRINMAYGTRWNAHIRQWEWGTTGLASQIVITCVDSKASRRAVHEEFINLRERRPIYWLDLGNDQKIGQVILGEFPCKDVPQGRLPLVSERFPDILDSTVPESDVPSCSLPEALQKQDLFINDAVTVFASNLLWNLFTLSEINFCGGFINLETGIALPIPLPDVVY